MDSRSNDGSKLASVGASPDFLLTVWNWRDEQTILRCKAFGQEVFNVQFAPNDGGFLTTSGTGHIRFWKMASTFTGLKLQGDIAKFGKSELSDIEAFCVLPDKKVLSSTERGALLLWDGNFIKCEIVTYNRQRAHKGPIHVVQYEPEWNQILTAGMSQSIRGTTHGKTIARHTGSDGMMKWWHFPEIDQADVKEDDSVAEVIPKDEFCYEPVGFKTFADNECVRHLSWRWDSTALLVTCANGVIGYFWPLAIDTERATYELELPTKTFVFRRVRKLNTEELVALASDSSVDAVKPTSYNPTPVSTAISFGEVEVGLGLSPPVLAAMYCCSSVNCFLVSVGGIHAGALYKCDWSSPFPLGAYPDDALGAAQTLTLSHSKKYVLAGNVNGKVHLRSRALPQQFDFVLSEAKRTYQVAHDRMAAQNDVRAADEPVASVYMTNPVYVGAKAYVAFMESYRIVDPETHHGVVRLLEACEPTAFPRITAVSVDPNAPDDRPRVKEAADITHKEAYTIQDAKLKLEADIRANSALAKKARQAAP
ncbi:hypothetical protein DYB32_006882 [Aphanomyces invadans]|uniref:Uncharacterized protein n=1 Tax=Aphanomyces invadans TaxID=157072 RepID=A0A3R7A675_9STRA|nr:hypothetical protein DYB32_006882 [Aphanomyces invadans]